MNFINRYSSQMFPLALLILAVICILYLLDRYLINPIQYKIESVFHSKSMKKFTNKLLEYSSYMEGYLGDKNDYYGIIKHVQQLNIPTQKKNDLINLLTKMQVKVNVQAIQTGR